MARRRSRPSGPKGTLVKALLAYLACAVLAVVTLNEHAAAVRSSQLQAHGVRADATVVSVHYIHGGKHGTVSATEVTVRLPQPVNGASNSVVHVPHQDYLSAGDTIAIMVDPQQPGYSELQGSPATTVLTWVLWLLGSVVLLAVGVFLTRQAVRLFRQRLAAGESAA